MRNSNLVVLREDILPCGLCICLSVKYFPLTVVMHIQVSERSYICLKSLTYVWFLLRNQFFFPLCYTVKAFLNAYIFACLNLNTFFWSGFHDGCSHFGLGECCAEGSVLDGRCQLQPWDPAEHDVHDANAKPCDSRRPLLLGVKGPTGFLFPGICAGSLRSVCWLLLQSVFLQYLKMQFITIEEWE